MLNIQKTSSLFKPDFNREKPTFLSHDGSGHNRRTKCRICNMAFRPRDKNELFCEQCRMIGKAYRFAESKAQGE